MPEEKDEKRKIYALFSAKAPTDFSVWSNLTKLYEHLKEDSDLPSYTTIYRKLQNSDSYKFMKGEEVYRIIVKRLQ